MNSCYQGRDQLLDRGLGPPEHRDVLDALDLQDDLLELVGVEVEVLVLDELLDPAVEVQVPLVIVVAEVARAKEAFAQTEEPGWRFNATMLFRPIFLALISDLFLGPFLIHFFRANI